MFGRQRAAPKKWKLILVSHTHWDREWYLPFQRFRAMLVEAVDSLLDLMATTPEYRYFTLDGQTILLEDYLEVRPERERELHHLIARGRILVGPWHVMPDEFLVSGESLVRNLLEGRRVATRFGPAMNVGYIPDPFGHIAQLPQILAGFGIDSAVLWRGTGSQVRHTESIWEAPDGSQVLLEHLAASYSSAALLPSAPDALMERLAQIRARLEPRATTCNLLLMNGDDHMFPQPDIPTIIAEANRRLRDAEVIHGTLPMFIDAVREAAASDGVEWERVRGEFRSSETAHLLAGVLSSRMEIKQRNTRCQTLLERWAEPFSCFAAILPRGPRTLMHGPLERLALDAPPLLRLAWRYLLMNQPHDSICGCSIDQVHQEMDTRYDWCEQIADLIGSRAMEAIAESTDTESLLRDGNAQGAIAVFNSEAGPRTDFVTCTVQLPGEPARVSLLTPDGLQVPYQLLREKRTEIASHTLSRNEMQGYLRLAGPGREWPPWKLRLLEKIVGAALRGRMPQLAVKDVDVVPGADPATVEVDVAAAAGKEHDYDAISAGMRQISNLVDRGDAQFFRIRVGRRDQAEIGFVAPEVPPHGVKLLRLASTAQASHGASGSRDESTLENEFLSLQISPEDGSARLLDRETGTIYWGFNSFVDGGDAGDEYTYSPPPRDRIVEGPDSRPTLVMEERGAARQMVRVESALRLPLGLTEDRQARTAETVLCPATTWISVYPSVRRVDVRTVFDNRARDHRLRVHFPTHLNARYSHSEGQFAVIRRPIEAAIDSTGWMEHPVSSSPQLAFADVSDGESGLMIANRGLPEFDVAMEERGCCLAITLLRCVGWLSRDDLATRQGAAGPTVATPGAQMLGVHSFDYSVIPHGGGWENALNQALWFARPLQARWTGRHAGPLPAETSFLAVSPGSLQISAIKPAENGSGHLVVRLYNALGTPTEGLLRTSFPISSAARVTLAEDQGDDLPLQDARTLRFPVGGHQIATLKLAPER